MLDAGQLLRQVTALFYFIFVVLLTLFMRHFLQPLAHSGLITSSLVSFSSALCFFASREGPFFTARGGEHTTVKKRKRKGKGVDVLLLASPQLVMGAHQELPSHGFPTLGF